MNESPLPFTVLRGHQSSVQSLCFVHRLESSSDSVGLFSGDVNGMIAYWDIHNRKMDLSHQSHEASVISLDLIDNKLLS